MADALECKRDLFGGFGDSGAEAQDDPGRVIYLNNAGRGPLLKSTEAIGIAALKEKSRPWVLKDNAEQVDEIRQLYLKALGTRDEACTQKLKHNVAVVPSTSYAMTLIARCLHIKAGDKVIVLNGQMSSNVMPWQQVCAEHDGSLLVVHRPSLEDGCWADAVLQALWHNAASVAAVALPNFLWSDGSFVNLEPIAVFCQEHKIPLVLDLTQSGGVVPLDLLTLRPTAVACSVHKWLVGPYGFSLLYVDDAFLQQQPLEFHDRSRQGTDESWWDEVGSMTSTGYPTAFKPGACRFDSGGRPNHIGVPMLLDALTHVAAWSPRAISGFCRPLLHQIIDGAKRLGFVVPMEHAPHFVGLRPPVPLEQQQDGDPCPPNPAKGNGQAWPTMSTLAKRLHNHHNVIASVRTGALRVSVYLYTTNSDADAFLSALEHQLHTWRNSQNPNYY